MITETDCLQLRALGLLIDPSVDLVMNMLFNGPVQISRNCSISNLKIDAYSVLQEHAHVHVATVGRYCTIGAGAESGLGIHDTETLTSSEAMDYRNHFLNDYELIERLEKAQLRNQEGFNEITVGHDVYIAPNVCIIKDVTIGTGAVIEAGSLITHDVPPYAIVSGVGGGQGSKNIIKGYRFTDEVISDLLESKWWEYDIPKLISQGHGAGAMAGADTSAVLSPWDRAEDFLAWMRDSDTSLWPRIEDKWHYMVYKKNRGIELRPCDKDQSYTPNFPEEMFPRSTWEW